MRFPSREKTSADLRTEPHEEQWQLIQIGRVVPKQKRQTFEFASGIYAHREVFVEHRRPFEEFVDDSLAGVK